MSATEGPEPTEAELKAAYEAEIKKIRVEHVLLEHIVTLVNLGMRRTGLMPGTESERDPAQVQLAIEAIRGLLPLVEQGSPAQAAPIRDALSQLQLAFVRIGGQGAHAAGAPGAAPGPGAGPGPDASSGPDAAPGPDASSGPDAAPGPDPAPGPAGAPAPAAGPAPSEPPPPKPGEPGPAQRSGRLWVPGQ